jgi:hypothetical protein
MFCAWFPLPPNMTPLDFYPRSSTKNLVHQPPLSASFQELQLGITAAVVITDASVHPATHLQKYGQKCYFDECCMPHGTHIQIL